LMKRHQPDPRVAQTYMPYKASEKLSQGLCLAFNLVKELF